MDNLLHKIDTAAWTENTALHESYYALREETVMLKAAMDTLTKQLDDNITMSTPPTLETMITSTAMEEMMMQLSHVQNDIQDILEAMCNPPGKGKQCTSSQDNEPTTPVNGQLAT